MNGRRCVLAGVPLLFALASVLAGKDANWDFLNYRWYDAWAFLHRRLETDVLVANHATFYNPLLELPFYLLATHVPAIIAGFCVALASTVIFVPLYLLSEETLGGLFNHYNCYSINPLSPTRGRGYEDPAERSSAPVEVGEGDSLQSCAVSTQAQTPTAGPSPTATKRWRAKSRSPLPVGEGIEKRQSFLRIIISTLIGLAGLLGGGVLGQIGIISWDVPLGTLTLFALYLIVKNQAACLRFASRDSTRGLLLAGFLVGAAAGFKLTAAIYPVGLVTGIFLASRLPAARRLWQIVLFSAGVGGGMLVFGGYWMARLYAAFGNPFFPYFNGLFHSAYAAPGSNRDTTFLPHDGLTAVFFPYFFTANSHRVAEYEFRDIHIALLFTLLPVLLLARTWRKPAVELAQPLAARFLLVSAAVSYIVWEALFSIYRYILPLEVLAPLLIVLAVALLPFSVRARVIMAAACLVLGLGAIKVDFNRRPWDAHYVVVQLPFAVPVDALVLMTGDGPMGYAATALPPSVPVLRVTSYLAQDNRFAERILREIHGQHGPFYALLPPDQKDVAKRALADYGLQLDPASCGQLTANIADPLLLCRVGRPVDMQ